MIRRRDRRIGSGADRADRVVYGSRDDAGDFGAMLLG